mmetsp:Transcript_100965/g.292053  ORF Transcript_100965/g.292053 Transcript_100965/m.292053 type:complete len:240 (+) Transcript_100965:418-1137(+)
MSLSSITNSPSCFSSFICSRSSCSNIFAVCGRPQCRAMSHFNDSTVCSLETDRTRSGPASEKAGGAKYNTLMQTPHCRGNTVHRTCTAAEVTPLHKDNTDMSLSSTPSLQSKSSACCGSSKVHRWSSLTAPPSRGEASSLAMPTVASMGTLTSKLALPSRIQTVTDFEVVGEVAVSSSGSESLPCVTLRLGSCHAEVSGARFRAGGGGRGGAAWESSSSRPPAAMAAAVTEVADCLGPG